LHLPPVIIAPVLMAESTGGRRKRYLFNIVGGKPVDVFHAGIVFRAGTYTGRPGYEQVDPPKALIAAVRDFVRRPR
jgi:hypothetical protein